MTEFRVWAPTPERVTLVAGDERVPMTGGADGWWSAEASAAPGTDYGFLLGDGDTPRPDPRSRRQPDGVHGLSRVFDPGAHHWGDGDWHGRPLAGGVIYELHIGTFTPEGTLDSAIERLDHLVDLGVDFVEVLPVNAFNGTHNWGYDGVAWFAVQETYGGPAAYQRFVDACHRRGLAVIQDVVYNHLGPSGNYLPEFGPYLHQASANTWGLSVNLDGPDSDEVRRYILDNVRMWFRDYHVDGLRLDAVHALLDHRATHLLEEIAIETDAASATLGRPLTLIAESDLNDPRMIRPRAAHGLGMTAQWSDDFHHALHVNLTGETVGYYADFDSVGALAKVLERGFFHDGTFSSFRGRTHGRPIDRERTPASALVVFAQDHDQIGNRAIGDRLTATLGEGRLRLAALLMLTAPNTPMLFMGEEWAASTPWQFFTSHPEPELGRATAEGRIAEFARMGWDPSVVPDPQDPETFTRSKLDWTEPYGDRDDGGDLHARTHALYRELLALRRARPELTDPRFGTVRVEYSEDERWIVLHRGALAVGVNLGDAPVTVPVSGHVLLATDAGASVSPEGLVLPAASGAVLDSA
ncbi:malto-oligosyltrehalose trehalohydrolase [Agromyces rhizosphaerae]|uniref:Malto-oligosyltrehalose trehalohydrolase n=1 Tax=Agromyces rhizosphaerae TaxID=88374 RepID=A0A9W6FNH0_9MICO|nr:malto-oligosyltrehalose trehalohydrolase [Agromyces rhizosphaerae]GLI26969.1 malto-oligosyltrehalose trehalohydrolase [Agromyces rhizosphaerae]